MTSTDQQWQIPEGTEVIGADGDKVGKVVAADSSSIVVEKGFFFPTDYAIPTSAISTFDGDTVYLTVTKDEVLNQGWDQERSDTTAGGYNTTVADYDTTGVDGVRDDTLGAGDRRATTGDAGTGNRTVDTSASTVSDTDTLRVPVHEEELTATTRPVERGQVRVDKEVIAEQRTLDVPITEERVTVTRRAVDRDATGDETAFDGGTIEIPLHSEAVDLQKRTRVAEEIEIGKEAVQRTEHVAGTVRREDVRVEDQSDADVMDGTTGTTTTPRRRNR